MYLEPTKLNFNFRRYKDCAKSLMLHEYKDKIVSVPDSRSGRNSFVAIDTLCQSPLLIFQLQPPSKGRHSSILTPTYVPVNIN
jgi:hypothetical protein